MLKSVKGGGITYDPRKGKITIDGDDYKNLVQQIEKKRRIKFQAPLSAQPPREPLDAKSNVIEIDGKCSDMGPYVACNGQKAQEAGFSCPNPQYALFPYTIEKKTGSLCYPKMNFNKVHQDEKKRQRAKARQAILQLIKVLAAFNDEEGTPEMCDVINKMTKQPPEVRKAYCEGLVSATPQLDPTTRRPMFVDGQPVMNRTHLCEYDGANQVCESKESIEKKKVPLGLSSEDSESLRELEEAIREAKDEGDADKARRLQEQYEREQKEAEERARIAREATERRRQAELEEERRLAAARAQAVQKLAAAQRKASVAFGKTQAAIKQASAALTDIRQLGASIDIVEEVRSAVRAVEDAVEAARNASNAANIADNVLDAENAASNAESAANKAEAAAREAQGKVTQQREANEAAAREARSKAVGDRNRPPRQEQGRGGPQPQGQGSTPQQPPGRGRGASPRPSGPAPGFPKTVTVEGVKIDLPGPEQEKYLNQVLNSNEYKNTKTFMKGTRASDDQVASFKNAHQNLASNIQLLVNDDEVSLYKNTFQQILSPSRSGGVGGAPGSSSQGSVGQTAASGVASSSAGLTELQRLAAAAEQAYA